MQKSLAMAAFAAVTLFVGAAYAQSPAEQAAAPPPTRGDRGALFVSPMGQAFRSAPESRHAPILVWQAHVDTDHDERISREEFMTEAMAFFAGDLDANRDGSVTPLESTEFRRLNAPETLNLDTAPVTVASSRERRESATGIRGARPVVRTQTGQGISELTPAGAGEAPRRSARLRQEEVMLGVEVEPVMSCDRDFSRRIDAAEFQACAERRFLALDINHDGYFMLYESDRARAMLEFYEQR